MYFKNIFLFLIIWATGLEALAQEKAAYQIFSKEGKKVSYQEMFRAVGKADVLFFGELHGNPIAHWLELEISQDLYKEHPSLTLGMEMFEADDQIVVNEYLKGLILEKHLRTEAKVWPNYATDYKPLLEFARSKGLDVIASNIPRRYANLVYRRGPGALDSLSEEARKWIAPLPLEVDLELPGYQKMITEMGHHVKPEDARNLLYAQAIKDATMAYFISQNRGANKFLHINGAYHSRNGEGIIWYLEKINPELSTATIETVEQASMDLLEEKHKQVADFVITLPLSMPKSQTNP